MIKASIFLGFPVFSTDLNMRRIPLYVICFSAMAASALPVRAGEMPPQKPIPNAALTGLARDFVSRISHGFSEADKAMNRGSETQESRIANLPDGEEIILKIILDKGMTLDNPLLAKTQKGKLVISFRDFCNILELPIAVDPAKGKATGWYVRENQTFDLDVASRIVKTPKGEFSYGDDVSVTEDDIYVPVDDLALWLGFKIKTNISGLSLVIETPEPLPIVDRLNRANKKLPGKGLGPAQLPLMVETIPLVDSPFVDVSTRSGYSKDGRTGKGDLRNDASVITAGDFMKGTLTTQTQLNDEEKISSIRANYKRQSMEPELLGPLQARKYELGDVNTAILPLGGGSSGQGVFVTNALPLRNFLNPATTITGNSFPGWDVELYRDGQLISFKTVGDDGMYRFEDIDLYTSENNFKIILYGPQGEVREEELNIPVDSDRLSEIGSAYAMSLVRQGNQTYIKSDSGSDVDKNGIHFSGVYEKPIGDRSAIAAGVETKQVRGEQEGSVQAGLSTNIAQTLFNLNGAVDSNNEMAAELVARRDLGAHKIRNETDWFTDSYGFIQDDEIREVFSNRFGVNGPLPIGLGKKTRYNFNLNYAMDSEEESQTTTAVGLNTTWRRLGLSQQFEYTKSSRAAENTLDSNTAIFGTVAQNRLRFGTNYQILPEKNLQSVAASLNRNLTNDLDLQLGVSREIDTKLTEGSAQMNWDAKFARITPGVTYNSNHDLIATLNTRFGLARDPGHGVHMLSRPLTGSGGLGVFVFLDRDGSGKFNEGDEVIPDASVMSLQSGGRQKTDDDGYAFFPNLQEFVQTDIVLDPNSLGDPFWIPGSKGASIMPRVGHVSQMEFPVHISGEIDGTLFSKAGGEPQPLGGVRMRLYAANGALQETSMTGPDGFYVLSKIPPGDYTLIVDSDDARLRSFIKPDPETITIGYDGTTIYGHDVYVTDGVGDVALNILSDLPPHDDANKGVLQSGSVILNLGDYNSRLLMGIMWYRLAFQYGVVLGDAAPLIAISNSEPSVKTGKHTLRVAVPGDTLAQATQRCRVLLRGRIACAVEMLPEKIASAE